MNSDEIIHYMTLHSTKLSYNWERYWVFSAMAPVERSADSWLIADWLIDSVTLQHHPVLSRLKLSITPSPNVPRDYYGLGCLVTHRKI